MVLKFAALLLLLSGVFGPGCGGSKTPPATSLTSSPTTAASTATPLPPTTAASPAATQTSASPAVSTAALPATAFPATSATAVPAATAAPVAVILPPAQPSLTRPVPPPTTFIVHANNLAYDTDKLTAASGSLVSVRFFNDDVGEEHHIEFGGKTPGIFPLRDLCRGPCTDSYTFVAPVPGTYEFFCVAHDGMVGTLIVTS